MTDSSKLLSRYRFVEALQLSAVMLAACVLSLTACGGSGAPTGGYTELELGLDIGSRMKVTVQEELIAVGEINMGASRTLVDDFVASYSDVEVEGEHKTAIEEVVAMAKELQEVLKPDKPSKTSIGMKLGALMDAAKALPDRPEGVDVPQSSEAE